MNNRGFWRRGWLTQVMAFVILLAGVVSAEAGTIYGTISNTSGRTGRVYLSLQKYGGDTGLGVSIAPTDTGWPNYAIRGVPNGSYTIKAFVDGSGTGILHANDPTWNSPGAINIYDGDHPVDTNSTVLFTTRPNVAPVKPPFVGIIPGDNGAFVGWDTPELNGNYIADSYKVYWSTTSNTPRTNPAGVITVPAGDQTFAAFNFANGTPLYIQVTALVGTTETTATTVASTTINPPAAGFSITGTIDLSGISNPVGNLSVALLDMSEDGGGPVAVAHVTNIPQLSNNFTITTNSTNVPNGTYAFIAFLDVNGDKRIGSGDIMIPEHQAPIVTVEGEDIDLGTIAMTRSNSSTFLNTSHWQDTNTPPNESYQILVNAESMLETITNITVTGGPGTNGLSYPIDLGINSWGQFQAWLNVNSNRPVVAPTPDTYNLSIQYANGVGPDAVNLPVTAVLDSFATPTAPVGNLPWSLVSNPTVFSWDAPTGPAPLPDPYTYSFWVNAPGFNNNNNAYYQMPSSTLSVPISGLSLNDGNSYGWDITVQDSFGNQAQKSAWFVYTNKPAITSFTPTTVLPGMTVTISGINFSPIAANNTVNFGCGRSAQATTASATQLTVVVPQDACLGSIQVVTNGNNFGNYSNTQLIIPWMSQINGQVTEFNTYNGIPNATVTASFTINSTQLTVSTTTDGNGNYNLPGVPQNTDFTLSFSATGYASAYTGTLNNTNWYSIALYPIATFNTWNGGDDTTGVIRGRVFEQSNSSGIADATVTAPGYEVIYDDGSGNMGSGTSTASNGVFYITHVPNGASVTITTTKPGYFITSPVSAAGHAGAISSIDVPGFPLISVTGTVVNSSNSAVSGATIEQVGTANSVTSSTDGAFTISNLPGGNNFELKMSLSPTYVPTYGWLNSPSNLTLPSPYILYTPAELSGVLGITGGKGAIIGRVVNSANPTVAISGATVTIYGPSSAVLYFNSATGLFSSATATDASGLFLVKDVEEGYNLGVNASVGTLINGNVNVTTHANAVSQITVPCYVPTPGWGSNLQSPASITMAPNQTTENIFGQVNIWGITDAGPGPATGLVAELGYGPQGTSPTNPSWTWKTADYNAQAGSNYVYVSNLTVSTVGNYDYAFRYSYYGGPYVYGDLWGIQNGNSPLPNPGRLSVAGPSWSIAGHVTDTYANSISGVVVSIFNSTNLQFLGSATTDMSGNYSVGNLAAGSYKVQFIPPSYYYGYYDSIWFTGKHDSATADTIVLVEPGVYTADAALTNGLTGGISGRVTDGVNGIAGVWVGVNVASNLAFVYGATTDAEGYYRIGGLVTGDYKVYFAGNSVGYQNLWHTGVLTPETASPVSVTAPYYFTDVNAVLTTAGAISGRVTNESLAGIANVQVIVSDATTGVWLANAMTDGSGNYTLGGMAAGNYKVFFDGSSVGYGRQWYNSKADINSANPVTVFAETTTPGINGVLPVAGSITGKVTYLSAGLPGVSVTVYDATNGIWITNTLTDASGNYIINGLPTGSYKLQYYKNGYVGQWYSNKTSQATADQVAVTAPGTTPLPDVVMQLPNINGFVYFSDGTPVSGATVTVVGYPSLTATTADGSYTINGIPVNQNFQIMASLGGYVTAYSTTFNTTGGNVSARELVLLTPTEVASAISPSTGAIIGQTVLGGGTGTTVEGVTVTIVSSTGTYTVLYDDGTGTNTYLPGGPTSANGRFLILGIADGDTIVLRATRPGWTLNNPKTYVVHQNAVTQGNLAGQYTTTTTVALTSGSNPSYAGNPLTYTATVSPTPPGGTVQFKVDGTNVGSPVPLAGGSATSAPITTLLPGPHNVTAVYSGAPGYGGNTSAGVPQTANSKVKIGGVENFLTLQNAIDLSYNNDTLLLRDTHFAEDLVVDSTAQRPAPFTITLKGGLGSDFFTPAVTASSARKLTIKHGKVIANRFVVKPD